MSIKIKNVVSISVVDGNTAITLSSGHILYIGESWTIVFDDIENDVIKIEK